MTRALAIPDPTLRRDALLALIDKRGYADGAAAFWILARRRNPDVLRAAVAFQTAANYIDLTSERAALQHYSARPGLTRSLVDAVAVGDPIGDYYCEHPWHDDGGYLDQLVDSCRRSCAALPTHALARPLLAVEAPRLRALELEHDPDPVRRDAQLEQWARKHYPDTDATWTEAAAGASAGLAVLVLLALAGDPTTTTQDLAAAAGAYAWVSRLSVALDGLVDHDEDAQAGSWNSIAHYGTAQAAADRLRTLIGRTNREIAALRRADHHRVLVAAMIGLFVSHDDARQPPAATAIQAIGPATGQLGQLTASFLRTWRHRTGVHGG